MIKVLRRFLSALQNRKAGGAAYSRRLELLGLEDRITPSNSPIIVTTTAASGTGSLDAAITQANTTPGDDQISFNLTGTSPYTITLASAALPTITGGAAGTLTINGLGATSLTISGNNGIGNRNFNIFNIAGGGNLTISGVTVSGAQKTSGNGGAFNNAGTLTVTNSTISGNSAIFGSGIYNSGGTLTVTNSTISGNFTSSSFGGGGGGIANSGSGIVTVTNSTLSGNTAYIGGGINNSGNLTVTNSTLSGNATSSSNGGGGGINNNTGGTLNVSNSTFSGNFAYRFGGAIYNRGTGILTVTNSTLSGNTATITGGGIDNVGTLTVTNSTLSSNTAFNGGAIYNRSSRTVTVTNSTLSGNTANGSGGGINNSGSTLTVTNTIIANSIRGGDFAGNAPNTNTNNLVEDGNISGSPYSWTVTGDPLLGPLQNNGGPTFTMALGFGSPAISATPLTPSNLDQRGFKRTNNDIGSTAYLAPAAINDIVISVNPSGQVGFFLSSAGTAITDFHTAFAGSTLTITAATLGNITGSGTGITIDNTAKTITVDLTLLSAFSGIFIEGNSGNDSVTIGAGGVDLSIVTGGGADQSLIITTGAGDDTLNINNAIKTKGTGAVLITNGGTVNDQVNLGATVITTGGNITFSNAVTLSAVAALSSNSGSIIFGSTLDGAQTLGLTAGTGTVTFTGTVGNSNQLSALTITSAGDVSIGAAMKVTGALGITSNSGVNVFLGAAGAGLSLTDAELDFIIAAGSLNITAAGAGTMTVNAVSGGGTISGITTLNAGGTGVTFATTASLFDNALTIASAATIAGVNITTSADAVIFSDAVTLTTAAVTIDTTNAAITFGGALDGAQTLGLTAGTGAVTFTGTVGNSAQLSALTITSAGDVSIDAAMKVTGAIDISSNSGVNVFLGTAGAGLSLTDAELDFITAAGSLNITAAGAGTMTVNAVSGGGTISGITTLNAGGTGVTFANTASLFDNALTVASAATIAEVNITTTNNDQTYTGNVVINANNLGNPIVLSAGSGAIGITGNIDSAVGQNYSLTLASTGDVTLGGTIGGTQALGALLITGNDISLGNIGGASAGTMQNVSVQASDGADNGSITLTGTTYKTTGQQFYNSSAVAGVVNDGTRPITLTGGATVSLSSGNGFESYGNWQLNNKVLSIDTTLLSATGSNIVVNDSRAASLQVFEGPGSLIVNSGTTGDVNINGAIGTSSTPLTALTITNAKNAFFSGALFLDALTITDVTDSATDTGLVQFIGNLTVNNSLTVSAAGGRYDVRMIGATNTIAGVTTFGNSGSLTLGVIGGDQFNFTGGIIATAPSVINLIGTVTAAGAGIITLGDSDTPLNVKSGNGFVGGASTGTITLGNAILEDNITLTVGTGIANTINMAAVTGTASPFSSNLILNTTGAVTVTGAVGTDIGNLTITNSGGTTFQSTVAAATATITNTTGTVAFQGNLNLTTSLLTAARGYNISITGNSNSIAGATAFLNTGLVTLGDDSGDTFAFDGGLTFTGNAASNIGAAITSSGDVINFGSGGVTLTQNTTVDTTTGSSTGAAIIFGGALKGSKTLGLTAGTGNITFTGTVGFGSGRRLGAVTVTSGATVLASTTFTAASFTQSAGSVETTFSDKVDLTNQFDFTGTILNINGTGTNSLVGTTMEVTNSGLFTAANGASLSVGTEFVQDGAGLNSIGGNIASTNDGISFLRGVTLTNSVLMSTGAGSGDDIFFSSTLDGAQTLGLTAGLGNITFTGAVGAGTRLGAVTVTSGATVLASTTFTAASFLQSAGSVATTFTGLVDLAGMFDFTGSVLNINGVGANLVGSTMEVSNSGLFTTVNGANLSVRNDFVQNGAGVNSIGGNIASTNDSISFLRGVTLTNGVTITTGAGTFDDINFRAGITGSFNLDLNAGTGGAITGTSVAINNLTITNGVSAAFTGAVTVNDLITATTATTISMTGTGNTFVQNVEFLNTGTVTLNNGSGDTTTFTGGLIVTAPSSITIKGTVAATNADMILNTGVILGANTTLNAGTGNINLNGIVSGSGAISLTPITSAPGITTISGANSNTTTNVTTGVVQINNSTPQTTNFVVSGGTLKGTGAIGNLTATGTGIIAPGNSPGKVTTTNLSLSSTNTLQIEITSANASPVAGTDYDQIVVSSGGTVDLNSAILNLSTTYTGIVGTVFTIIDNQHLSASIQGTFAGLAQGAFISANGRAYQISYIGGNGNDVTLTVYNLPSVTSFNPTTGKTGTSVVITGSDFTNVSQVSFNGTVQPTYTVNSPTQITTTVPSGATTGTISVTNNAGIGTSSASFTVDNTAPTLSISASPGSLKANETSTITFTFSEVVTGFSSSIITVTNGTITNPVTSSSTVYTAIFTPTLGIKADGTIAVSNNYFDLVGNQGTASSLTPPIAINTVQTPLVTGGASTTQGGASVVSLIDPNTGAIIGSAVPFPGFTGEIRVVSGDFNGDGKVDIIAAAGPGGGPAVSILDSETGEFMESFFAFDPAFTGGVFIAVRDFNGDGILDIIAGAGAGGGPEVRIFNGDGLTVIRSFFAYAEDFKGGVSVASIDFNSDGILDLVTGAGQGGAPHVKVFDGATNAIISQWYAYPISFTGGVFVAAGDIGNDGNIEVVTGAGAGGTPVVAVWDPYTGALLAQFMAYAEDFTGGARVGVSDGNFDGILDLITGAGPGGGPEVKGFSFPTLDLLFSFFSGDPSNTSGVFVS
jgi:hypothetical protein